MGIYKTLSLKHKNNLRTAFLYKKNNKNYEISYKRFFRLVANFAENLVRLGIKKNDSIGIMLPNSIEWVIIDLAGLKIGAKIIPIPININKKNLHFFVKDSKMKLLVSEKKFKVDVKQILVKNFKKYLEELGTEVKENIDIEDIATICYTSGSTGLPKGVMLSHKNILYNVLNQPVKFSEKDIFLSYLPLSHMFERTCGYYTPLFKGATIALCPDYKKLTDYAQEFKPTIMLAIPRVLEKINEKLEEEKVRRMIKIPLIRKIVGKKIKKKLGGKIKIIVSGGAPLDRELSRKLWKLGIEVYEGYGMTECSPIIATNFQKYNKIGSVGKPLKGIKIKISGGKIYVKSPGLMKGYTNKEKSKEKMKNGWLDTGDLGHIDKEGFLYINGRADDCIVMSTGKKAFPEPIERKLNRIENVEQVFVYGDKKPYLIALFVGSLNKKDLNKKIDNINNRLFPHERIKKFEIIDNPFTIENGLLTHTFKLRREKIYEQYKKVIEKIYEK